MPAEGSGRGAHGEDGQVRAYFMPVESPGESPRSPRGEGTHVAPRGPPGRADPPAPRPPPRPAAGRVWELKNFLEAVGAQMRADVEAQDGRKRLRLPRAMSVAVACTSLDSLDAALLALRGLPRAEVHAAHAGLGAGGVRAAVEEFRGWGVRAAAPARAPDIDVHTMTRGEVAERNEAARRAWMGRPQLHVLVATDVCVGAVAGDPLAVDLLVHLEPARRDAVRRRQARLQGPADAAAAEVRRMLEDEGSEGARVEVVVSAPGDPAPAAVLGVPRHRGPQPLPIDVADVFS